MLPAGLCGLLLVANPPENKPGTAGVDTSRAFSTAYINNGCLYKRWLNFRVCEETCLSKSGNCHSLAQVCTGKFGHFLPYTDDQRTVKMQFRSFNYR